MKKRRIVIILTLFCLASVFMFAGLKIMLSPAGFKTFFRKNFPGLHMEITKRISVGREVPGIGKKRGLPLFQIIFSKKA